jgi:periplasmic divalent cation tolerance protein
MHSYEVPCVISLTITEDEGNEDYLDWLEKNSKLDLLHFSRHEVKVYCGRNNNTYIWE